MIIKNLRLYDLRITPNDTLHFDTIYEQENFFNNLPYKEFVNSVSLNGSRDLRLEGNIAYFYSNNYNYLSYTIASNKNPNPNTDFTFYCFIDSVNYLNDNSVSISVTIDLIQTYLIPYQNVTNYFKYNNNYVVTSTRTVKESEFKYYLPYSNKLDVTDYEIHRLTSFTKTGLKSQSADHIHSGFVIMNIDANCPNIVDKYYTYIDKGYNTNFKTLIFPIAYSKNRYDYSGEIIGNYSDVKVDGDVDMDILGGFDPRLSDFINQNSEYIFNIGMKFEGINVYGLGYDGKYVTVDGNSDININSIKFIDPDTNEETTKKVLEVKKTIFYNEIEIDLDDYINEIPLPLRRSPYVYLRLGPYYEEQTINLLDFTPQNKGNNDGLTGTTLKIKTYTSLTFPFETSFFFSYGEDDKFLQIDDPNKVFTTISTKSLPVVASAWYDFYNQNRASVNDGLSTQQKFERTNLEYGAAAGAAKTLVHAGTAIAKTIDVRATPYDSLASGLNTAIDTLSTYSQGLNNLNKERALLDISWNDVKSRPSEAINVNSTPFTQLFAGVPTTHLDIVIARNINDIKQFHNRFGYEINRVERRSGLIPQQQHTLFDYYKTTDVTVSTSFPSLVRNSLEALLNEGIRFWYKYDDFLDYSKPNNEKEVIYE